jgi:membrane-bound ClpP family serine protease
VDVPLPSRLALAQRVVLVISLGLALLAVGLYVSTLGLSGTAGGIANATFLSPSQAFTPPMVLSPVGPDLTPWEQLLVWLGLILVWATGSIVILRASRATPAEP